jgi:hypothetical protein
MEKLNEYINKCANEIKSRGLCEKGDEAHPAFFMIAVTESPAANNVNISTAISGDSLRLGAAIVSALDKNPMLASIFKSAVMTQLVKKMGTEVKCNTKC